jgi:hypothetical protein
MIFTTNKSLSDWGKVLHDDDLATSILDRILERGRLIQLDGPSGRTRHLNLEEVLPDPAERARISGIRVPEFPEPTRSFLLWLLLLADYCCKQALTRFDRWSSSAMAMFQHSYSPGAFQIEGPSMGVDRRPPRRWRIT